MINKLIVDGVNITLNESSALPFTYTFSTAGIHNVRVGLDNTEEICAYAFKDCADLTKVTFPSRITMIKRNAFENCESLKSIDIPSTIKYVGPNVFDGCTALSEINFEDTSAPNFLTNLSDSITCYIPDGSKFVLADELVKDGSVQYYEKNALGGYDEVDYEALEDGNEYYYDAWLGVHTHTNVVEQRFKNKPTSISFYDGDTPVTVFPDVEQGTETNLFNYRFVPENTSNTNVVFISTNPNLVSVDQNGHISCAENVSGRSTIYVCTEPDYNGTYVFAQLNIRVTNNTGIVKTEPNISFNVESLDVTDVNNYTLPTVDNEENLELTWASSNENVATVDENGELTIVGNGIATITATFAGNNVHLGKQISYELNINDESLKQNIELSFNSESANANAIGELVNKPTLVNTNNVELVWTSSNEEVATVDENGNVTIIADGTTTITASFAGNSQYNAKEASYTLTVSIEVEKQDPQIAFSENSITANFVGEFDEPEITNTNNLELVWSSSNENVATVNQLGEVTIIANGVTTISATFAGNDTYNAKTISYELTVQLVQLFYIGTTKPDENNIGTLDVEEYGDWTSQNPYSLDFSQMGNGTYWMMLPKNETVVVIDTNNGFEMGYSKDSTITYLGNEYDIHEIELGTSIYSVYKAS